MTPSQQVKQELKELDLYLDALCQQVDKDAGNLWIQFTDKFNAFKKLISGFEYGQKDGWVSVEDGELPAIAKDVLVRITGYKQTFVGFWNGVSWFVNFINGQYEVKHDDVEPFHITHWLPLPSPPTTDKK